MSVKAPSRLVLTLSRRRPAHAPRRLHQAVARSPPSRGPSASSLVNEDYLHALYEDLMVLDSATPWTSLPGADLSQHTKEESPCDVAGPVLGDIPSQTAALGPSSQTVDVLLAEYAKQGNIQDLELFISRMRSAPPTEHHRDLHVKAHIVNASLSTHPSSLSPVQQFPTSALAVLHQYEASGHFAPIKSYTRVISALFNVQTCPSSDPTLGRTAARAQAWDLFSHMRYVAHPVPDAHLYALMIRACGSFSRPEPERALDLWTEMLANGVKPTKGAYEAVIRVCGRAGPDWIGEGMRIAREMSDHYPITGVNGRGLWCGLLEGCKRAGDLQKARWILAEAVRGDKDGASSEDSIVDAELMTHMFHTYASYKPPFIRETTRLIDRNMASNGEMSADELRAEDTLTRSDSPSHMSAGQAPAGDTFPDVPMKTVESMPSFSHLPPQTSFDIIAETQALFRMILQDRYPSRKASEDGLLVGRFAHVELTPVLLNAYLSVFYRHATIEASQDAFDSLFNNSSGVQVSRPDEYIYISALERCAIARAEDRHIAVRWARDIWQGWEATEENGVRDGKRNVGQFARLIEKAHSVMRRVLILSGDIDGALALLRSFVSRYPPNAVLQPADSQQVSMDATSLIVKPVKSLSESPTVQHFAKSPILSTRTVLTNLASSASTAARPLVRLTSVVTPKDDRIPPVIGFTEVELLHTRLVEHERIKDIGYIKWVCMAYANALKKRREAVLKAASTSRGHTVD